MEAKLARKERILVVGGPSPLLDGVADLLQLAGYRVDSTATWVQAEKLLNGVPPHLTIVDTSALAADPQQLSDRIAQASGWATAPILCVGFSDDARIRELQRRADRGIHNHLRFYAHTLLGMDGLLDVVRDTLG